jgi:hypothetical protein
VIPFRTSAALAVWIAVAPLAAAQTLELRVSRIEISMGEVFPVELVVTASSGVAIGQVDLPGLHQFDVHSGPDVGMSMQVDMTRGVSSSVHSYRWQVAPRQLGSYVLGPASVMVGGRPMRSNSVALKVVQGAAGAVDAVDPRMFVAATADKPRAVVGEQITITYALYSRVNYMGLELRKEPTTAGFWVEEIEVPRGFAMRQEVVGGAAYRVQVLKQQAVFALKPGRLTIGPMVIDAQIGIGFFGGGQRMTRASKPLDLDVTPLPSEGRPAGFAEANVGQFSLTGGVDRARVQMGEAVKYRLQLEGAGNIKNIVLPELPQGTGYRRFDPEPKISVRIQNGRVVGTRTLEYLLSPSAPGHFTVPAIVLSYFDPAAGQYRAASIAEATVSVLGAAGVPVAQMTPQSTSVLPGADPDLRAIHEDVSPATPFGFHRGVWFWALLFAPPLLFGLVALLGRVAAYRSVQRSKGEPGRRAAQAMRRLRDAEQHLKRDDAAALFAEISSVLSTVLEAKLGQPIGSLTMPELERTLVERGISADAAQLVVRELENCDFGRFAPRGTRGDEMRAALDRSRSLLHTLDRTKLAHAGGAR